MKIEFWLDPFCPYSYLAHVQLQSCLKQTGKHAELEYKFLRTRPEVFDEQEAQEGSFVEWFGKVNDQEKVWAELKFEQFQTLANELDVELNIKNISPVTSTDLTQYVAKADLAGKATMFMDELFDAMFVNNTKITASFIESMLSSLLVESQEGPFVTEATEQDIVQKAEQEKSLIAELGLSQAPTMIINEEMGLEGVQPNEHLVEVLNMVDSV